MAKIFSICASIAFLTFSILPASGHHGCGHHGAPCGDWNVLSHDCRPGSNCGAAAESARAALEGRVAEVVYLAASDSFVEIKLRTSAGLETVRLAPAAFLKRNGLNLKAGDMVTIKAFRVSGMNGDLTVATEIEKAGQTVVLRDRNGRGRW